MEYIKQAFQLLISGDGELIEIILTTLLMAFFSTGVSSLIGIPLGAFIGSHHFKGKKTILKILNTLMSLPPVVAGLIVFMLFRSVGPLGSFRIMFTVRIMIIAQVVLITPVIASLSAAAVGEKIGSLTETAKGIGLSPSKQLRLIISEFSSQFISIILMGFGRSIAEVGAVSLVGGNIQFKTRVMTTAILLEANRGDFRKALALGIILMLISLIVNFAAGSFGEKKK